MYQPTTRVLTVLELLQAHGRLSGAELAARLEVDRRTVRRYVTMLQDLGIPVEAERGRYGGYRLRPGFKLPPLMFTPDEAVGLTLGLLLARRLSLSVAAPALEGALAKIERVLPAALREQVEAVQETLVLDVASPHRLPESATVVTLSAAIRQGRQVWLRYRARGAEGETERVVDPYGLVYHGGRWYAVGHCHLRGGLRTFRLDRVLAAEPREGAFSRPPDFDSLAHVLHSLATTPWGWSVEVLLETTIEEARHHISPAFATLEEAPGGVLMRCEAANLEYAAHALAGFDCPVVVRRPPELREALHRLAAKVAALAERMEPVEAASASAGS
jgi:predicted DNA-binding transcriptional regulator YafY